MNDAGRITGMPTDDELLQFETVGAASLPSAATYMYVEHEAARIYCATYGLGEPVVLLHGGFGNGENWGYQVDSLVAAGYRAILIDTRGHGRSTRDARSFSYELLAHDVLAVLDALTIERAAFAGWSDGATTALVLAMLAPERVNGVFFFAGNMDLGGVREVEPSPILNRIFGIHKRAYERLSPTPDDFASFSQAVQQMMQTQPNYTAHDLAKIRVPVAIVQSENDEFIKPEHAAYLARTIPNAELIELAQVSHFAPLQRPQVFDAALLAFLGRLP